jgi:adenylate cyclase
MPPETIKRKLAAIFNADVEGYGRLMGKDEEGTICTLNAYREAITGFIRHHQGCVVDTAGDSVLAEFASVVEAVRCAVAIQKEIKERNKELSEDRRMDFRIGINLGDIVEQGNRILGDGVNIAARVQALSEPGGICISGTAYDHVKNKLDLRYEYAGDHALKNITEPVRVYRVCGESNAVVKEKGVSQLVEKPSIAVLPLRNSSGDPKYERLSDGITEEIINSIGKASHLVVIGRNSAFTYKGKTLKAQQVAEELGVRYVLEGSLQVSEERVRITAQFIDATCGHSLFSERFDGTLKNFFAIQDEITMRILAAMRIKLSRGEEERVFAKGTRNFESYLKLAEAREVMNGFNKETLLRARQLAEEAIALDPDYALAYSTAAALISNAAAINAYNDPRPELERGMELVQKAISLNDGLAHPHTILAQYHVRLNRDYDKAVVEVERAMNLEPDSSSVFANAGTIFKLAGQYEAALRALNKAISLSPQPNPIMLHNLGHAYSFLGRYEEAVAIYGKSRELSPNHMVTHLSVVATLVLMGKGDEALKEAQGVLRIDPNFLVEPYAEITRQAYRNQDDVEHILIEPLRKAGLR